jgi:hypothetical protein
LKHGENGVGLIIIFLIFVDFFFFFSGGYPPMREYSQLGGRSPDNREFSMADSDFPALPATAPTAGGSAPQGLFVLFCFVHFLLLVLF